MLIHQSSSSMNLPQLVIWKSFVAVQIGSFSPSLKFFEFIPLREWTNLFTMEFIASIASLFLDEKKYKQDNCSNNNDNCNYNVSSWASWESSLLQNVVLSCLSIHWIQLLMNECIEDQQCCLLHWIQYYKQILTESSARRPPEDTLTSEKNYV